VSTLLKFDIKGIKMG